MRNKFLGLFIAFFTIISVFSCREDDKIFDKNASERLNQTLIETRDLLTSAKNGWLIKMFPGKEMKYGGYNLIAKFDKGGNVEATNELIENFERHKSIYSLNGGNGPTISFVTFNKAIHIFSEPRANDNFPDSNPQTGADGDLVFTIVSVSKDKVLLKGIRSGVVITAVPFPSEYTWESYLEKSLEMKDKFISEVFEFVVSGKSFRGKNDESSNNRVLKMEQKNTHKTIDIPFRFTPDGIEIYGEQELGGVNFSYLKSVKDTDNFNNSENTVIYKPVILPLTEKYLSNIWYLSYNNSGSPMQRAIDAADKFPSTTGIALSPLRFLVLGMFDNGTKHTFLSQYTWQGRPYNIYFDIDHKVINDTEIEMTANIAKITGNSDSNLLYSYGFNRILPVFLGINTPTVYTLTADNPKKPSKIKFTDKADSNNWFEITSEAKYDPRNK